MRITYIESRSWPTNWTGRMGIHVGKNCQSLEEIRELVRRKFRIEIPADLPFGAVIGSMDLIDCVEKSPSKWFERPYGWVLKSAKAYATPIEMPGRVGYFSIDPQRLKGQE